MKRRQFLACGAAALGGSFIASMAGCKKSLSYGNDDPKSWPRRPVTILVPFDVGGATQS